MCVVLAVAYAGRLVKPGPMSTLIVMDCFVAWHAQPIPGGVEDQRRCGRRDYDRDRAYKGYLPRGVQGQRMGAQSGRIGV